MGIDITFCVFLTCPFPGPLLEQAFIGGSPRPPSVPFAFSR